MGKSGTTTYNFTSDPGDSGHGIAPYSQSAAFNQPLTVTDNLGHVTHMRYDAQDNKTAEIDALGHETDRQYNVANQLLLVQYPATGQSGTGRAGDLSVYLYPGGPILTDSKYDESNTQVRQVQLTYGPEGELLSQVGDGQPEYVTYDGIYRPASFSDGKSQATTFTYNAAGYAATETYPNGNLVQFTQYDGAGNLLTQIDGRGVEIDFLYTDPESLLTEIQYPATTALNVHKTYDNYGRKSAVTDGAGSYSYAYDDLNKQTSVATTYTGLPAQTISYAYYPDGSHQSMTTPAGTFTYTDDAAGRAAGLTNPYSEASSWTFLNNNWIATQNSGGIVTATYTHNARGLITDLTNKRNSDSALLSEFGSIVYDSVGNMDSVTASVPSATAYSGTTSYAYNPKNELNTETGTGTGGYTNNFAYDGAGNPTTFKSATNTFNSANQNTANTYDAAGNPTTYGGVSVTFDAESRMTAYGSVLTNGYRGDSLRAWKQNSGGKTYFLYAGSVPVCELNSSGTVTATNTFGPAGLISRHTSSGSIFYAFDAHGSVSERVTSSGSIASAQTFDAYGTRQSTDGNTDPYAGFGGQSGYYTDWETGTINAALELLTFRYYDPAVGRFLNRDPAGYGGGANSYEYVSNGPTNGSDPLGLFVWGAAGGCMGAIAGNLLGSMTDGDSCDSKYNECLTMGDCVVDAASAIAGAVTIAAAVAAEPGLGLLARIGYGCFEGLLSALGHTVVEVGCRATYHPCDPGADPWCTLISDVSDIVSGCLDGLLGNIMKGEDEEVKQAVELTAEYVLAMLGNGTESSNCFGMGKQGL